MMRLIDPQMYDSDLKKKFRREKYQSECQDWQTPDDFIEELMSALGINCFAFDACCTDHNIPAEIYITEQGTFSRGEQELNGNHGLNAIWPDGIGWMNPPYGADLKKFILKITEQTAKCIDCKLVALLPQRFENEYFHTHVLAKASGIYFLRGKKLVFKLPGGFAANNKSQVAPQKICLAFFNFDRDYLMRIAEYLNKTRFTGIMIEPNVLETETTPL